MITTPFVDISSTESLGVNWADATVNITTLLTSESAIDRAKGQVYWTLRNDPNNYLSGDQLMYQKIGQEGIIELYMQRCLGHFIGDTITADVLTEVSRMTTRHLGEIFETPPQVTISINEQDPTQLNIDLLLDGPIDYIDLPVSVLSCQDEQ